MNILHPTKIAASVCKVGVKKANRTVLELLILGFMAGALVGLGAQGATIAIHGIPNFSVSRLVSGLMLSIGLIMVTVSGGELFLGNNLMIIPLLEKRISLKAMVRNLSIVYFANFLGGVVIAILLYYSHQFSYSNGMLGGFTIKFAYDKVTMTFRGALFSGILCGWIICTGVLMSYSTRVMTGKVVAVFVAMLLYGASGIDNSVANMHHIPAGIIAMNSTRYLEAAYKGYGLTVMDLKQLNWITMFSRNLLPATIGNIIGGCGFVGYFYWLANMKKHGNKKYC